MLEALTKPLMLVELAKRIVARQHTIDQLNGLMEMHFSTLRRLNETHASDAETLDATNTQHNIAIRQLAVELGIDAKSPRPKAVQIGDNIVTIGYAAHGQVYAKVARLVGGAI